MPRQAWSRILGRYGGGAGTMVRIGRCGGACVPAVAMWSGERHRAECGFVPSSQLRRRPPRAPSRVRSMQRPPRILCTGRVCDVYAMCNSPCRRVARLRPPAFSESAVTVTRTSAGIATTRKCTCTTPLSMQHHQCNARSTRSNQGHSTFENHSRHSLNSVDRNKASSKTRTHGSPVSTPLCLA